MFCVDNDHTEYAVNKKVKPTQKVAKTLYRLFGEIQSFANEMPSIKPWMSPIIKVSTVFISKKRLTGSEYFKT